MVQSLQRQGQVWYALMSGDMDPSRLLTFDDYLGASRALLSALTELAWNFMSRIAGRMGVAPWLIGIVVAAGLIIAAFVLKSLLFAILSLAIFILIVLGVSVATMRGLLRQALQQVGDQLWDAELINSIGHAVVRLPQLPSR